MSYADLNVATSFDSEKNTACLQLSADGTLAAPHHSVQVLHVNLKLGLRSLVAAPVLTALLLKVGRQHVLDALLQESGQTKKGVLDRLHQSAQLLSVRL